MEPVMYRGDMIIAYGWKAPNFERGDIVMWRVKRSPIIVHRIIDIFKEETEERRFLTKGDNNPVADFELYRKYGHDKPNGRAFFLVLIFFFLEGLSSDQIVSQVLWHIPKIGYPIMLAKEHMAITVIVSLLGDVIWKRLWHKKWIKLGEIVCSLFIDLLLFCGFHFSVL
jgi:signal peptidase I